jgi:hypothetical protein
MTSFSEAISKFPFSSTFHHSPPSTAPSPSNYFSLLSPLSSLFCSSSVSNK